MTDCGCEFEATNDAQRQTLRIVLVINAVMFLAEFSAGWIARSTGLIADSLDMLADASVYAISLFAVGRSLRIRRHAAMTSGILQVTLGVAVVVEAIRRFLADSEPVGAAMMGVGLIALLANAVCLKLIAKHKEGDVNFRASYIFSVNDVIANIGVILSGALVLLLSSRIPDLVIGTVIAAVVVRGGIKIIADAMSERE